MTWRFKVQGVAFGILVLGGLALASGASWVDDFLNAIGYGWGW